MAWSRNQRTTFVIPDRYTLNGRPHRPNENAPAFDINFTWQRRQELEELRRSLRNKMYATKSIWEGEWVRNSREALRLRFQVGHFEQANPGDKINMMDIYKLHLRVSASRARALRRQSQRRYEQHFGV